MGKVTERLVDLIGLDRTAQLDTHRTVLEESLRRALDAAEGKPAAKAKAARSFHIREICDRPRARASRLSPVQEGALPSRGPDPFLAPNTARPSVG
jgi:hypothetical protein